MQFKEITDKVYNGVKMMAEMGTPASEVANAVIKAVKADEPLPRYAVGICLFSAGFVGLISSEKSFRISNNFSYVLIFISVLFLVRSTAYSALIANNELKLFDPRTNYEINYEIGFEQLNEDWVAPLDRDQCWANIKCNASRSIIEFKQIGIFKIAYK